VDKFLACDDRPGVTYSQHFRLDDFEVSQDDVVVGQCLLSVEGLLNTEAGSGRDPKRAVELVLMDGRTWCLPSR
jgi:hypothetical protein